MFADAQIVDLLRESRNPLTGTSFDSPARIVFSRCTAWLLVALIALPFTAPFSTCDLSMLLACPDAPTSRIAIHQGDRSGFLEQASAQTASVSVLDEDQFKTTVPVAAATDVVALEDAHTAVGVSQHASLHDLPLLALRL